MDYIQPNTNSKLPNKVQERWWQYYLSIFFLSLNEYL